MKQLIYLDNAATTKTRPEVVEAMLPYFTEYYGNPSSVYDFSTESKKAVNHARRPLPSHWGQRPMRYISRPEAARLITGPWWPRLRPMEIKENTS